MRLTRYTDYSLRLLIYLGLRQGQLATIGEAARHFGISHNHLMKVARQLGAQGYIATIRGKGGGLRLSRDPASICLGQVIRDMETRFPMAECFAPDGFCKIEPACRLKRILGQALDAFLRVLDACTLADLLQNRDQLANLLELTDLAAGGSRA